SLSTPSTPFSIFFSLLTPPPPLSTLFPYTTLFRSLLVVCAVLRLVRLALENAAIDQELPPLVVAVAGKERVVEVEQGEAHESARSEETRLNSSHVSISYAVFCLKKKKKKKNIEITI